MLDILINCIANYHILYIGQLEIRVSVRLSKVKLTKRSIKGQLK